MRAYRYCGMTLASRLDLPMLDADAGSTAACAIDIDPPSEPVITPHQWFHHWRVGRGAPWVSFARIDAGYLLRFPDLAEFIVSRDGGAVRVRPRRGVPDDTLQHLLVDQVLPLALARRGRLVLHASAVHLPDAGVVAFAGSTGRGKSTLAAALASRRGRILADDCAAIEWIDGRPHVHPAYPGLRLWPDTHARTMRHAAGARVAHYTRKRRVDGSVLRFHAQPGPLRALFLLGSRTTSGPAIAVRRSRASARLMELVKYAYVLDVEDRHELSRVFDGLATLATTVPILTLRVRHGLARLPDAAQAIASHVAARCS